MRIPVFVHSLPLPILSLRSWGPAALAPGGTPSCLERMASKGDRWSPLVEPRCNTALLGNFRQSDDAVWMPSLWNTAHPCYTPNFPLSVPIFRQLSLLLGDIKGRRGTPTSREKQKRGSHCKRSPAAADRRTQSTCQFSSFSVKAHTAHPSSGRSLPVEYHTPHLPK